MQDEMLELKATIKYLQAQISVFDNEDTQNKIQKDKLEIMEIKVKNLKKLNKDYEEKIDKLEGEISRKNKQIDEERRSVLDEIKRRVINSIINIFFNFLIIG